MIVAGIDCGTWGTKVVTWSDRRREFECAPVRQNKGLAVESVALRALSEALGLSDPLAGVRSIAATGSSASKLPFAETKVVESTCLAKAAAAFAPTVRTVIDGGAAKVLVIRCNCGEPLAVASSSRCAAGSGIYLETAAEILGIPVSDLGRLALASTDSVAVQSTCAVFAESEIISLVHSGKRIEDIAMGVVVSTVNRINPLLRTVKWEMDVAIVGGIARNEAVVRGLNGLIARPVFIPPQAEHYAALGACLIAKENAGC